jgi:hemolysin activation/secretion protein
MIRRTRFTPILSALTTGTLIGSAVVAASASALGQDFQRIAPKELPANPELRELPAPPVSPALPSNAKVLVPALKGLVFLSKADQVQPHGTTAAGIDAARVDVLDQARFRELLAPYLGQPVTLDRLNDIVKQTVVFYREQDHPLVDVVVPEQDISGGSVQIVVVEFTAGSIRAEGNEWFSSDLLTSAIHLNSGDRVLGSALVDDVNTLNQNPFRRVDLVYQRGGQPGRSDIILRTTDRFPLRVYAGFENSGSETTGRERLMAGFNWGNVAGLGHILNYQITGSSDVMPWESYPRIEGRPRLPRYLAHSGSYIAPLPWGHQLSFYGAYAKTVPTLTNSFNSVGVSWQTGGRYAIPLPRVSDYRHDLSFGADFKRTNNNLDFGGTRVYGGNIDIAQGVIDYSGSLPDAWGSTRWSINLTLSPGGITSNNTTRAFTAQGGRAGSRADYAYGRLGVDRVFTLPSDFALNMRYQLQLANTALQSSEQFGIGGATTVRGYGERTANGDQGWLYSTELQAPSFSVIDTVTNGKENRDAMRFHVFFDMGRVSNLKEIVGVPRAVTLTSAGAGFRYVLQPYASAAFDYGVQLRSAPNARTKSGMAHVSIVIGL